MADPYRAGTTRDRKQFRSLLTSHGFTRSYKTSQPPYEITRRSWLLLAHGTYFSALTSICRSLGNVGYVGDTIHVPIGAAVSAIPCWFGRCGSEKKGGKIFLTNVPQKLESGIWRYRCNELGRIFTSCLWRSFFCASRKHVCIITFERNSPICSVPVRFIYPRIDMLELCDY